MAKVEVPNFGFDETSRVNDEQAGFTTVCGTYGREQTRRFDFTKDGMVRTIDWVRGRDVMIIHSLHNASGDIELRFVEAKGRRNFLAVVEFMQGGDEQRLVCEYDDRGEPLKETNGSFPYKLDLAEVFAKVESSDVGGWQDVISRFKFVPVLVPA